MRRKMVTGSKGRDEGEVGKKNSEGNTEWDQLREETAAVAAALLRDRRARKRFIGVRQRPSGRWVAEIKDTVHNIRVWLGTYDTAEQAAKAYDEAACLIRGANTRTNFWPCTSSHSKPALPPKIANLLLHRLKATSTSTVAPFPNTNQCEQETKVELKPHPLFHQKEEPPFDNFLDYPENGIFAESYDGANHSSGAMTSDDHGCETNEISFNEEACRKEFKLKYDSPASVDEGNNQIMMPKGEFEDSDVGHIDFHFVDNVGSLCYSSLFEITEEMVGPMEGENYGEEPSVVRETIKMMKYERKFSACLYTLMGVSECLKLQVGSETAKGLENFEG